ncbi:fasciclin domain-containing protein [Phenylobacterium sp.]|uniref:fasciclin domain-containing protein n=1 Tax=Phenylobacterium sp. TaxID=1871053 RepID=UPI002731060A|nr:fasciclin domain-containing protein [Phenylobacterium sp.]MDP1875712.1 fasciclin domain-containing protein [Phenylobacterium sp.]
MRLTRLVTATAIAALMAGAAHAQVADPAPSTPTAGLPSAQAGADARAGAQVAPAGDIVETVEAAGQFTTLVAALEATNLVQLLKTTPNLTIFAPTDAAFAALPAGELDRLMADENRAELQKLLTYHVVNARLDASKIEGAQGPVPTVAGENLQVNDVGEVWTVGQARVTQSDINADNGVIHVVDKVLMPGDATVAAAGADASASIPSPDATTPAAPATGASVTGESDAPTGIAADTAATASDVQMQPIPDTPENRAAYGAPLSSAGKRTAAESN